MRVRLQHRRLAEELARSGLTSNRWAQRLGLSSGHLSDLVNGKRPYPTARTRARLLQGLDLPFDELFEIEQPAGVGTVDVSEGGTPPSVPVRFRDGSRDVPRAARRPRRKGPDMLSVMHDLRYAARALRRSPGYTAVALLSLAIGIGSNTALFSMVDSILWKPYPYHDAERLVVVSAIQDGADRGSSMSLPDISDLRQRASQLAGLAAWDWEPYALAGGEQPIRVGGSRVSARYFEVLGVRPQRGRTFHEEEDRPGGERVVILSEGLWASYFGSDPDVVGRSVTIDSQPTTVIGVMPAGSEYPDQTELWVPLAFDEESAPRGANFLGTIARLAPGATVDELNAELQALGRRIEEDHPETNRGIGFRAAPLRELLTGELQPLSLLVLVVVTFVLLIVCANVANLLLSRGVARQREVAIRRALGASKRRLAQLLLCEAVLLALFGGLLGFAVGWLGLHQLLRLVDVDVPPWISTGMAARVLGYSAFVSLLAAGLSSLLPILSDLRGAATSVLQRAGRRLGSGRRGGRLQGSLVVSEVALCFILLVGAGLMVESLLGLSRVDPGFEAEGAVTVGIDLLALRDAEVEKRAARFSSFLERFAAAPGVEAVGAVHLFPLTRRSHSVTVALPGQDPEAIRSNPSPQIGYATAQYFRAMEIPLLAGRTLSTPSEGGEEEVVVSARLAAALWPDEDPLGQELRFAYEEEEEWLRVRGVVGDIHQRGLEEEALPHLYVPYHRAAPARMMVVVRSDEALEPLIAALRGAAREVDPLQPLHDVEGVADLVARSLWQWRFFNVLFWLFGAVALLLAMAGIYGVMSYTVAQRSGEVGIRIALGAAQRDVLGMLLRQGGNLVLLGLAVGIPLAVLVSTLLSRLLYAVAPFEPLILVAAAALLTLAALPAVLLPAGRALHVDPATSLRLD